MITYENIKEANKTIKTTDIKGKNYAEVNQRIKAFRMVYPTGTIETQLVSNENGICIFKAVVGFIDDNNNLVILGTGNAYEKEGSSFINKTSYIENCETSAVGRALGMAGFGIDVSIASAEEVENAITQQEEMKKQEEELREQLIGQKEIDILRATEKKYNKEGADTLLVLMKYGYKKFEEVKKKDYAKIGNELSK
jgi:hypothetical protein